MILSARGQVASGHKRCKRDLGASYHVDKLADIVKRFAGEVVIVYQLINIPIIDILSSVENVVNLHARAFNDGWVVVTQIRPAEATHLEVAVKDATQQSSTGTLVGNNQSVFHVVAK